jgi:hypothetical protein
MRTKQEPSTSDDDFIKQDNEDDSSSNASDSDDDNETYEPESKSSKVSPEAFYTWYWVEIENHIVAVVS